MKYIRVMGLLVAILAAWQGTEVTIVNRADASAKKYSWPNFQQELQPGPSTTSVKAELPDVVLTPAAVGTKAEIAAYGGVWEGWMCRNAAVDIKVAVTNVDDSAATVEYASGSSDFGKYYERISARFSDDTLQGKFDNNAMLILGLRSDGHMNVKYDSKNWCTGILRRAKAAPQ